MGTPPNTKDAINPNYYRITVDGHECQVFDVVKAVGAQHDLYLGTALIYFLRAGRKPGNSKKQEIEKGIRWLQQGLNEGMYDETVDA